MLAHLHGLYPERGIDLCYRSHIEWLPMAIYKQQMDRRHRSGKHGCNRRILTHTVYQAEVVSRDYFQLPPHDQGPRLARSYQHNRARGIGSDKCTRMEYSDFPTVQLSRRPALSIHAPDTCLVLTFQAECESFHPGNRIKGSTALKGSLPLRFELPTTIHKSC